MAAKSAQALLGIVLLACAPQLLQAGKIADCADTDPADYGSVFNCMASYRIEGAGSSMFLKSSSCMSMAAHYASALKASGIKKVNKRKLKATGAMPSCELMTLVLTEFNNDGPWWAGCLGYSAELGAAHVQRCLTHMVPRYARRKVSNLRSCTEAIRFYEVGLKAVDWNNKLPAGYKQPDCGDIAALLGEGDKKAGWQACLGFAPDKIKTHLKTCLAAAPVRFTDCTQVRNSYETRLRQAYGGRLPKGYTILTCKMAEPILKAERDRIAKLKEAQNPAKACPYSPGRNPGNLYKPQSKSVFDAPAKCGPYFVYVDKCLAKKFYSPFGVYTISKTPPDEDTDTIIEEWSYKTRIATDHQTLSYKRKIGRDDVRYADFGSHFGTYYGKENLCWPYKWDKPEFLKALEFIISLEIPLPPGITSGFQ